MLLSELLLPIAGIGEGWEDGAAIREHGKQKKGDMNMEPRGREGEGGGV